MKNKKEEYPAYIQADNAGKDVRKLIRQAQRRGKVYVQIGKPSGCGTPGHPPC